MVILPDEVLPKVHIDFHNTMRVSSLKQTEYNRIKERHLHVISHAKECGLSDEAIDILHKVLFY